MKHFIPLAGLLAASLTMAACADGTEPADAGTNPTMSSQTSSAGGDPAQLPRGSEPGMLVIDTAWMQPHPGGRDVTSAYVTARLERGEPDRLLAAEIEGASEVSLHGHEMDAQGMMSMRAIGPVDIDKGTPLNFAPGGQHLMVFGLAPVEVGDQVSGWLIFERAGRVPVTFEVRTAASVLAD
ncbi:copper chaperone PCu(A)C [Maricaulis sp. CAU 1757]